MKTFVKKLNHHIVKLFAVATLLTVQQFNHSTAHAQVSFSPPPTVPTNSATWVPSPQTNVIIGYMFIPQHTVRIQNTGFGTTNALQIPFYLSLDGTNKIFYATSWTNPTNYVPSLTNTTDTVIFPATNVPIYAAAAILTTNDAASLGVSIFLVQ